MKASDIVRSRLAAAPLVALSGFLGGAVLLTSVVEMANPRNAATFASAGLAGAVVYFLLWLGVTALCSRRTSRGAAGLAPATGLVFAFSLAPLISYLPYLMYRTSLQGDSVELPPLSSRPSAIMLLVWSLLLLTVLLRMTLGGADSRFIPALTRRPAVTLTLMIVAWLAVFFPLDVLKDQYMQTTTVNSAFFRESMTHVLDNRGFMFSNLAYGSGASIFSVHISAIFIFIFPLFRIWPDYRFLLLLGDIALALSAVPVYLIARRRFSSALSLLFAGMVLLSPIITAAPGRGDFSEIRLMPVLFLTAFYFFEKKRFWMFMLASVAMMTIREDMGLFIAFFGFYGIIRRRSLKWILAPLAAGFGWFGLMGGILLPRIGPSGTAVRASMRYANLGSSGSEIARTIVFRPWRALRAALSTPSHVGAVYGILQISGLGVALLSGAVIFAIPAAAELLFQQTTTFNNFMAVPLVPTLTVAVVLGLDRLDRFSRHRFNIDAGRTAALVGVFIFFVSVSPFHTWFNPGLYQPRYNYDAAREAFSRVPANARLIMPEFMLAYSQPDQTLRGYHQVQYQEDIEGRFVLTEDYVILDRRVPARLAADNRYYDGIETVRNIVDNSPDFEKVFARDDIELYVRKGS
ncbi:MAG: DUF2079 domain-containing protein [Thermoleophilia bacterium]